MAIDKTALANHARPIAEEDHVAFDFNRMSRASHLAWQGYCKARDDDYNHYRGESAADWSRLYTVCRDGNPHYEPEAKAAAYRRVHLLYED